MHIGITLYAATKISTYYITDDDFRVLLPDTVYSSYVHNG